MATVYVLTPDIPLPVGGIRQHYRLVDTLNESGIHAAVVHRDEGFRCRWFENTTPVVYAKKTVATQDDLIVIPEEHIELVPTLAPGVPKIVFNQNAYVTFLSSLSAVATRDAYHHPDLWSAVVVSDDNADYLRGTFPGLRVDRIRYEIDTQLYHTRDSKRRVLSYMPRKRSVECTEVLALLQLSGALQGWEVLPIDGVSEHEAAAMLRASSVFLSFSYREGFGLPPAEAMASGCVVVGFDGFAGREFFGNHALSIPDGDVQAYCRIAGDVLRTWDQRREDFRQMAATGEQFVTNTYSREAHRQSVVGVFAAAMAAPRTVSAQEQLEVPRFGSPRWKAAAHEIKDALLHGTPTRRLKLIAAAVSLLSRGFV